MTYRTRDTKFGLKTRFLKQREPRYGAITRVVGDTPMKSLKEVAVETLETATDDSDSRVIAAAMAAAHIGDAIDRLVVTSLIEAHQNRRKETDVPDIVVTVQQVVLKVTESDWKLIMKSLASTAGVKLSWKPEEKARAEALNKTLLEQRVAILKEQLMVAEGALKKAEDESHEEVSG